jgi:hypothetical protein
VLEQTGELVYAVHPQLGLAAHVPWLVQWGADELQWEFTRQDTHVWFEQNGAALVHSELLVQAAEANLDKHNARTTADKNTTLLIYDAN